MIIDCAEMAKCKTDSALISSLADQTGYWPVFSFLSSFSNLIDLAAVGLIGQKAGFSKPVEEQLRGMLDVVGVALKQVSVNSLQHAEDAKKCAQDKIRMDEEKAKRKQRILRGVWHDGRLDCVAGNGAMSELGMGDEPISLGDMEPIEDEYMVGATVAPETSSATEKAADKEIDPEAETIHSLPIIVLKNFAQKSARGDLWNVLSEWGAGLIENHVAYVIVVTEGPVATKALNKALPAKPLNTVSLSDADETNSLTYLQNKLASMSASHKYTLTAEEQAQVHKLGGRMIDLETLVYKIRTGSSIADAVDDIILRNLVELRKAAFGDDPEDTKSLPWSRAQAWKIVYELAKGNEVAYSKLLQEFPFKGSEQSLKALEEHELISVSYVDGRPDKIRPGKPVFTYVFKDLVRDTVFAASCQIEFNNAIIAKAESDIKACEAELTTLKEIASNGGEQALGLSDSFLGLGGGNALKARAKWLLQTMSGSLEKLNKLEKDNAENVKLLSSGKA